MLSSFQLSTSFYAEQLRQSVNLQRLYTCSRIVTFGIENFGNFLRNSDGTLIAITYRIAKQFPVVVNQAEIDTPSVNPQTHNRIAF